MGWDAYAGDPVSRTSILEPEHYREFIRAAKRVHDKCGSYDGLLEAGGLDVDTSGHCLYIATGRGTYDDDGWRADEVRKLHAHANWEFQVSDFSECFKESAREFLDICARLGLGIWFSY